MAKMTKTQKARMIRDILSKSQKLTLVDASTGFRAGTFASNLGMPFTINDLAAIQKICARAIKRI